MKLLNNDLDALHDDVIHFIGENIDIWLSNGLAPCQITVIKMQASIFKDVTAHTFNVILEAYCRKHGIVFQNGHPRRVNGRTLKCYIFQKKLN